VIKEDNMLFKMTICFCLVFLVFGFGIIFGTQDSQDEGIVAGSLLEKVRKKLKDPTFDRERAMMEAAVQGDLPTVQLLLDNGVQPYGIFDETERTVFHEAAASGSAEVFEALLRAADNAGYLRDCIHAMDNQYRTPLYDAALQGNIAVVRLLLDNGAIIDTGGQDGLRALHLAVIKGNDELVDLLLSRGAFILARDDEGKRALDYARALRHDKMAKKLERETQNYWEKPIVREISTAVENYLNALRASDITTALRLSTERHRKVLGDKLDPASFQYDIKEVEIHDKEARAITSIMKQKDEILLYCLIELYRSEEGWLVSRTTFNYSDRWEEIR
jgi:hypothetical protein